MKSSCGIPFLIRFLRVKLHFWSNCGYRRVDMCGKSGLYICILHSWYNLHILTCLHIKLYCICPIRIEIIHGSLMDIYWFYLKLALYPSKGQPVVKYPLKGATRGKISIHSSSHNSFLNFNYGQMIFSTVLVHGLGFYQKFSVVCIGKYLFAQQGKCIEECSLSIFMKMK